MSLTLQEQETTINFGRDGHLCTVYTSDSTVMTRLDKLVKNEKADWKLKEVHRLSGGEIVGKTYETNKRLISFRAYTASRELTDDQKEAAAKRMSDYHARKKLEKDNENR